jgi:hypothetical protein
MCQFGAEITQLTEDLPDKPGEHYTVLHLVARKAIDLERWAYTKGNAGASGSQARRNRNRKSSVYKMLDLLMDKLQPEKINVVIDSELGSVLHYFAALDYAKGIYKLAREPYNHPWDVENREGEPPYLVAVKSRSFASLQQLLDLEANEGSFCCDLQTEDNDEASKCDIFDVLNRVSTKYKGKGNRFVYPDNIF